MTTDNKPQRTGAIVFAEIEAKLATIDGISTADAFALGSLVREYGDVSAGEALKATLGPILDTMGPKKKPWE